jgi:hypothetical protein
MQNVQMTVKGDELTIKCSLSQNLGPSKSGKSLGIASTGGNVSIPNHPEVKLGLNLYRPAGGADA